MELYTVILVHTFSNSYRYLNRKALMLGIGSTIAIIEIYCCSIFHDKTQMAQGEIGGKTKVVSVISIITCNCYLQYRYF